MGSRRHIGSFAMELGHCRLVSLIFGLLVPAAACATDVTVSGLFPNKAVVQIDGGPLQTLSVGQKTPQGVVLVSVDRESATFDIDGKRMTLGLGVGRITSTLPTMESTVVTADTQGHFIAEGQVNGASIRFVVDTGATLVSLPASDARRLSLDYLKGQKVTMGTANGPAAGYLIRLDTVQIGKVLQRNVDAVVIEGTGLTAPLLGLSFLNRMNMKREGDVMTLTRRY